MELILLGLVAGIGFASYALWSKARSVQERQEPRRLTTGERTLTNIQIGDIVQHLERDFLVEGALIFVDHGRRSNLYRLVDGRKEQFLYVATGGEPVLLEELELELEGAPLQFERDGRPYRLERRLLVEAVQAGSMGERFIGQPLNAPLINRGQETSCSLLEYRAGSFRVLVIDRAGERETFAGERVGAHSLEILPIR